MFQYNTAKDELIASRTFNLEVKHSAQVCAQSVSVSSNGNLMINLKWEILSGDDSGKKVIDRVTLSGNTLDRLDQFAAAVGKDLSKEWGGQTVDEAFLSRWAESLLGETALLDLRMGKATAEYASKVEVKAYAPLSGVTTGASDINLD